MIDVNISGISFRMDNTTFELLNDYLERMAIAYRQENDTEEGDDILADLEGRICELILEVQQSQVPVGHHLVERIIAQLGQPEEIADMTPTAGEGAVRETTASGTQSAGLGAGLGTGSDPKSPAPTETQIPPVSSSTIKRRLYRDRAHARLFGVCSGLGAYFNVDPTWIRLIFLLPIIISCATEMFSLNHPFNWIPNTLDSLRSASVMLYMALFILTPKARTPREKLEMRGDEITAASIQELYRQEGMGNPETHEAPNILLRALKIIFNAFGILIGAVLLFVIIIVALAMFGTRWLGDINLGHPPLSSLPEVSPWLSIVGGILLAVIPLIILLLCIFKWKSDLKRHTMLLIILALLWLLIHASLSILRLGSDMHIGRIFSNMTYNSTLITTPLVADSIRVEAITVNDSVIMDTIRTRVVTLPE